MLFRSTRERLFRRVVTDESYRALWRYACRLSHNLTDAEDLLQETLTRAYERIDQLQNPEAGRTWLYRIMYSLYVNFHHRSKRQLEFSLIQDLVEDEAGRVEDDPVADGVRAELANLPALQRQTVEMYYFEEMSVEEIAEIFESNCNTVKQRLFRARESLRNAMRGAWRGMHGPDAGNVAG